MSSNVLFGTNGIRGIANLELTPEFATKVGLAIGTYFGQKRILVGYDSRTSSPLISRAVIIGLASAGCDVFDGGYAPTPSIQYAVKHFKMDGAILVTASHNPPEYNGIKVVGGDGVEIPREEEIKIENIFFGEKFTRKRWNALGSISIFPGIIDVHKDAVKKHVDVKSISKKRFKVVVDAANSVGALITPYLLRELGCDVVTLNAQLDGNFPGRLPEPKPETLGDLASTVKAIKADLGVAHDGDADRCIFVDESGKVCLGDSTGAIIIDYILQKHHDGIVVTPVSSSKMVEDVITMRGGKIVWTKVGSTTVSKVMQEVNSIISMEDNGGIFYAPHQPVRDGPMAAALMLEILAKREKTLSQLVAELPKYYIIKERINCPNELKQTVLDSVLKQTEKLNSLTLDGIKISFEDGSVLIRPSGTEEIFRVYSEAKNEERCKEMAAWGISLVEKSIQSLNSKKK
ncbi:MAG: phosphomannomutase / phosphoglucomutase [Thermoproteota archaeon]|nr:phosphomannomutase / phosphoglucomutase [Thermoproteota archaeon]